MEEPVAAMEGLIASNLIIDGDDVISFDSDSSGDSKLRRVLERKYITSPNHRRNPSDHREGVPADSPQRKPSKDRRRPRASSFQTDRSPIPYSWYYNPYSQRDYSPSVSSVTPRKSISSWMDAMLRTHPSEQNMQDNDDSSIDSVEQLERAALQIRSEIRQLEMKELADEAEEAAEAGHERFAGRASTFGVDSSHSLNYVDLENPKPLKLKRYSTYSEGTSLLRQVRPARPKPKIRVLQLRDISEVIPSMEDLHSHLKTHLVLAGVDQRSVIHSPAETEVDKKRSDAVKTPVQFLNSLKSWVSTTPSRSSVKSPDTDIASDSTTPRQTTAGRNSKQLLDSLEVNEEEKEDGDGSIASLVSGGSYEVGGRLSAHLHAPKAVHRSPIKIPKGLDLPDDLGIPHELPSKILLHEADVETVETVPTSSSSQQGDSNQGIGVEHDLEGLTPIELFAQHEEEYEASQDGRRDPGCCGNAAIEASPLPTDVEPPNAFDTPMRLRGIRKSSRRLSLRRASSVHESTDLVWPVNVVHLPHSNSDPQGLVEDDNPLNVPLLAVKSDGDCSPAAPLSRSKDADDFDLHDLASLPMSGAPLGDNMFPELERPKSLSFDEQDMVRSSESAEETTEEPLFMEDSEDIRPRLSHDMSLLIAPSDEIELNRNSSTMLDGPKADANESHDRSGTLPLMPTLEKIDEPPHLDTSNIVHDSVETAEDLPMPTIVPRIEKRPSSIPGTEPDNSSQHSLDLEEVFETRDPSITRDDAAGCDGSRRRPSLVEVAESVRIEASKLADHPINAKQECVACQKDSVAPSSDSAGTSNGAVPHPIPLFDQSELTLDEEHVTTSAAVALSQLEFEIDRPDDEIEMDSCLVDSDEDTALPPPDVSIEVKDLNDVDCSFQQPSPCNSPGRVERREEIVRSPSGRVRVTIEQQSSSQENGSHEHDDDDDVRSDADSARTPTQHPCECLINAATQLEDSVGADLARATEFARAKYDFSSHAEKDAKNTSVVSAPGHFPSFPDSPSRAAFREEEVAITRSPMRRALSCPSLFALEADADESDTIIPHKGLSPWQRNGRDFASDWILAERREYFHSSSMLDPCQSASPFRETVDDMMKSFSPKKLQAEKALRLQTLENREFLHNYLYCGKPSQPSPEETTEPNMCGDHCDYFSGVLDAYRSIVPPRSGSGKDMLSLNAGDNSLASSAATETWFDVASEHFDGALETLMGRAHAQSRRWNSMFQAPGLKSKKGNKAPSSPRSTGVVLVRQSSALDAQEGELSDTQFELLYGLSREQFAKLPVTERSVLNDVVNERRKRWASRSSSKADLEPPSPAISVRSRSSSDLSR